MNLNDTYVYVFVRQDLKMGFQMVAMGHAVMSIGEHSGMFGCEGIPNMVVIGIPDEAALMRVDGKLRFHQLPAVRWMDPDSNHLGVLSIATMPLREDQRLMLKNYRLWNENNNTFHSPASAAVPRTGDSSENKASMPAGEPVCQRSSVEAEHRPLRPEVGGSIPSAGSILEEKWDPPVCC